MISTYNARLANTACYPREVFNFGLYIIIYHMYRTRPFSGKQIMMLLDDNCQAFFYFLCAACTCSTANTYTKLHIQLCSN